MSKIISILNHKGGVGKTTSAVNIGAGLQQIGKKILLIDLDPQANLTIHVGLSPDVPQTIYGALRNEYPLPVSQVKPGLDAVVSTLDLSAVEIELNNEPGREYILRDLIAPVRSNYDYILIDCPPSLGLLTINALSASDRMIIAVEASAFALMGMKKLFDIIEKVRARLNKGLAGYRILITKYDSRKIIQKDIRDTIKKQYAGNVYQTEIRTNVSLEEATMAGQSIFDTAPKSNGAEDYMTVCHEIIKEK